MFLRLESAGQLIQVDFELCQPAGTAISTQNGRRLGVAVLLGGANGGLLDPVLNGALRHVDERVVPRDLLDLDIAVDRRLNIDGEPRLALLPVDELAGRAFPPTTSNS